MIKETWQIQSAFPSLFQQGKSVWRQGLNISGEIDVGVIEIYRDAIPENAVYYLVAVDNLLEAFEEITIGSDMLIFGPHWATMTLCIIS